MLSCPAFEIFFGGSAGGGKSKGLLMDAIKQTDNPNYKALLLRRTFAELGKADGLIEESQKIFRGVGGTYNQSEKRWRFPSKSIIDFGHMETEADKHNYQSAQYDKIYFDELTSFTETQYKYMFSRCRGTDKSIDRGIRSASNPGNTGHTWVKRRFIDGKQPYKVYTDEIGNTSVFIPASVFENKYLMETDPDYVNRLKMLPENDRKALLEGNWDIFEGQYFGMWDKAKLTQFKPILEGYKRFISMDYGYYNPCSVNWWAVSYDGELINYRELYQELLTYEDLAHRIIELSENEEIDYIVADPAIWGDKSHHKGLGESGAETMSKVLRNKYGDKSPSLIRADNSRITGWNRLREYLNAGKIYCYENCVNALRTIPSLIHDQKRVEDLDTTGEDHAADSWRYGVMSRVSASDIPLVRPKNAIKTPKTLEESDNLLQEIFEDA